MEDDNLNIIDPSIFDIDESINEKDYANLSKQERFETYMSGKKIDILNQFVNASTKINCKCQICNNTWSALPRDIKSFGCPKCRRIRQYKIDFNLFWKRTQQIIKDKNGTVKKYKKLVEDVKPLRSDWIVINCMYGHQFTTSHINLYKDHWCPTCGKSRSLEGGKLTSDAVYNAKNKKKVTDEQYRITCAKKGATLLGSTKINGSIIYRIECIKCGAIMKRTGVQLRKRVYLCDNKCVKGISVTHNQIPSWEYKD